MVFSKQWLFHPAFVELIYFDQNGKISYEIELHRIEKSGPDSIMEWVFHVLEKSWADPITIYGLVQALEYFCRRRPKDWRVFPRPEEKAEEGLKVISVGELFESVDQSDVRWAEESKNLAKRAIKAGLIQEFEE